MNSKNTYEISIVVPVFNEDAVLREFHQRIILVRDKLKVSCEIVYVNDGSSDDSCNILKTLVQNDNDVTVVNFSRNFGKEAALTAGLDIAKGNAVIVIDADLQDPPELIPTLYTELNNGFDIVYAKRSSRRGESLLKQTLAKIYYRCLNSLSGVKIPLDTGDFRIMSRRAVDTLRTIKEKRRYLKGLFAWIGYSQKAVYFDRDQRHAGKTKWNYLKLWNLAIEGITSFSTVPLKLVTFIGLVTSFTSFLYAAVIIYKTLMFGDPVKGYPSLMVVILFIGGVQIFSIGILGEYLGRMFDEVKNRPLYVIESIMKNEEN